MPTDVYWDVYWALRAARVRPDDAAIAASKAHNKACEEEASA